MDPTQPTSKKPSDTEDHVPEVTEADLAQAFKDLARGEKTAQALESNLTSLEQKIDDLLASFEESERLKVEAMNSSGNSKKNDSGRP